MNRVATYNNISLSDKLFVDKLTSIVEANLESRQFGVEKLALEVGMSRSLIYRKLQSITGQSVSQFIRNIRLEKAMDLLKQNAGSISDIAYQVGFGSPAYFNTCFHDRYGFTPGEVKYHNFPKTNHQPGIMYKRLFLTLIFLLAVIISWLVYGSFIDQDSRHKAIPVSEKSIAILPFKNLSDDPENKFITFGIVDNILSQLTGIKGIRTISSTSSENYISSSESLIEIGRELNADFILEGSVQKYGDNIQIIAQLINAHNDKHIWSKDFEIEPKDIIQVEHQIAKKIAYELNDVISQTEINSIDELTTSNFEAHNLYVKGRFFLLGRSREGYQKSLDFFSKAIEIDPGYSLAYAGLAETYSCLIDWKVIPLSEGYPKVKDLTLKALSLNPSLVYAQTLLADISWRYERNFKLAEQQFKKIMEIAPNDAKLYFLYALFQRSIGRESEARKYIDKAVLLDPIYQMNHYTSARFYYEQGLLYDALEELEKTLEIDPDFLPAYFRLFFVYAELDMPDKAFQSIKKSITNDEAIDEIYRTSGIEGIFYYLIELAKKKRPQAYGEVAGYYAFLDKKEETLYWLKKCISEEELIASTLNILNSRHYDKYRSDPEFQPIFNKLEQEKNRLLN